LLRGQRLPGPAVAEGVGRRNARGLGRRPAADPRRQRDRGAARRLLAGPLIGKPGLVTAEIDRRELAGARYDFDAVGHYARPDVFRLTVDERANQAIAFVDSGED
jgi:hypothetical protein